MTIEFHRNDTYISISWKEPQLRPVGNPETSPFRGGERWNNPRPRTPRQIRREPRVQLSHLAAIVRCSWLHLITARKLPLSFREVGTFIIEHLSGNRLSFIVSLYSSAGSSTRSRVRYDQERHWTFVWLSTSIVPISSCTIKLIAELWPAMSPLTLCQDLDMLVYGHL